MQLQKRHHLGGISFVQHEVFQRHGDRHFFFQRHQPSGYARLVGLFDQPFAALGLFDVCSIGQHTIQIAVFVDQQRRRFDPNAFDTGHVIG